MTAVVDLDAGHHPYRFRIRDRITGALVVEADLTTEGVGHRPQHICAPSQVEADLDVLEVGAADRVEVAVAVDVHHLDLRSHAVVTPVDAGVDDDVAGDEADRPDVEGEVHASGETGGTRHFHLAIRETDPVAAEAGGVDGHVTVRVVAVDGLRRAHHAVPGTENGAGLAPADVVHAVGDAVAVDVHPVEERVADALAVGDAAAELVRVELESDRD